MILSVAYVRKMLYFIESEIPAISLFLLIGFYFSHHYHQSIVKEYEFLILWSCTCLGYIDR